MTNKSGGELLKSGDPGEGWQGKIGKTLKESTPWWRPQVKAPEGAPNIVFILLDDLGFSDFGCYGSEIATPAIDKIAAEGLRLTGYTTVPMCTPARAALMTGKNPHSVGCGWLTHANPGYPGYQAGEITPDAPTLPELLRSTGYSTYAVGKWHNTADYNVSAAANRSAWPLQRGFDRFYGFLGAETNYHSPSQIIEGNELVPFDSYPENYFCTDDWTSRAISWMRAHRTVCPRKPFFLYYATNAPHVPLHVKPSDLAKYKGRYDLGWDKLREARYARQRELGVIGDSWRLPTRYAGVPAWSDTPPDSRAVMAGYMELYAALVDSVDQCVARITAELEFLGIADNTLIMITSDNGASSIGGPDGAANVFEKRVTQLEDAEMPKKMLAEGTLGGVNSYPAYPIGWGNASNTPFRFFKRTPMNGGIRVPFIIRWPDRIKDRGAIRREWVHATDVLPTVLNLLGQDYPEQFNGYRTRGLNGVPFTDMLTSQSAPSRRVSQHYELEGNRGFISGNWKIVSLQPPGSKIDLSNWMLFDLSSDPTECDNLAAQKPDVLADMIALFEADAAANYLYPLDNRGMLRGTTLPPFLEADLNESHAFYPGTETTHPYLVSRLIADRDFTLTAAFSWESGQEGVLFSTGDSSGGFASWIAHGKCHFAWRGAQVKRIISIAMSSGEQRLTVSHHAKGKRQAEATVTLDRQGGGEPVAQSIDMSPTILRLAGEGMDVGLDRRLKVVPEYDGKGVYRYSGRIDWVHIEPGPMAPGSLVNRAEALAQID